MVSDTPSARAAANAAADRALDEGLGPLKPTQHNRYVRLVGVARRLGVSPRTLEHRGAAEPQRFARTYKIDGLRCLDADEAERWIARFNSDELRRKPSTRSQGRRSHVAQSEPLILFQPPPHLPGPAPRSRPDGTALSNHARRNQARRAATRV